MLNLNVFIILLFLEHFQLYLIKLEDELFLEFNKSIYFLHYCTLIKPSFQISLHLLKAIYFFVLLRTGNT